MTKEKALSLLSIAVGLTVIAIIALVASGMVFAIYFITTKIFHHG